MSERTLARRLASALGAGLLVVGLTAVPAAGAAPVTRWVDDDGSAGPTGCAGEVRSESSVQAAVDASGAGDSVLVCPGTYVEQILVRGARDGLTVRAVRPWTAVIVTPATLHPVVVVDPGAAGSEGVGITALLAVRGVDDVTVQGLRLIVRTQPPCSAVDFGILSVGSEGTTIRGDRLRTSGGDTLGACPLGSGIAVVDAFPGSDPAAGSSATIAYNLVEDFIYDGIAAVGYQTSTRATIERNTIRYEHAVTPARARASVARSTVPRWRGEAGTTRSAWDVMLAAGGMDPGGAGPSGASRDGASPSDSGPCYCGYGVTIVGRARATVTGNAIDSAPGAQLQPGMTLAEVVPALERGIAVFGLDGPAPPSLVRDNRIRRAYAGIWAQGARDLSLVGNDARITVGGIVLEGVTGSSVVANVTGGSVDGIFVATDGSANVLRGNTATGGGHACRDLSTGSGTAGTADRWIDDIGHGGPSQPAAICPLR